MTIKKCCDEIFSNRHEGEQGFYRNSDGSIDIAYEDNEYLTIDVIFHDVKYCPYCGKKLEWTDQEIAEEMRLC